MYVSVKLLNGFSEQLLYKVPVTLQNNNLHGQIVFVPLQRRTEQAIVCAVFAERPTEATFKIRELLDVEIIPADARYYQFIENLSSYYAIDPMQLYKRMRHTFIEAEKEQPVVPEHTISAAHVVLTAEQQQVVDFLAPHITTPTYQPTLLHGVTGSGKTEVYNKLIQQAWHEQKTTLLLLPEVSLAATFTTILRARLSSDIQIFGFHSATTPKEKRQLWQMLLAQKPIVIIGVHMPILLPIANLGLIIIDEEHEVGFQEKKHPRINTKEAALLRAKLYNIPILLGSATPSISSWYNVSERGWNFFQMQQRFAGKFPKISLVTLTKDKRREFWISRELEKAIADRLAKKEQVIIFLNRRGFSFSVHCGGCSFIFACDNCSVSLTYHDNQQLRCHYCDAMKKLVTACPACAAPESTFIKKGIGTQRAVAIIQNLFPQARIGRADADCTRDKKRWQKTISDFKEQQLDILIGTQTITKGYHFPHVTLVGILWAELGLGVPHYNASETTLQRLIQVAGRAGRASEFSEVIVQTFSDNALFEYLNEVRYADFYMYEIAYRKELGYPPCMRFAEIELRSADDVTLEKEARDCAAKIKQLIKQHDLKITLLGPSQPPVHKVKHVHMRRIYLKGADIKQCIKLFNVVSKNNSYTSSLFFTPNPVN